MPMRQKFDRSVYLFSVSFLFLKLKTTSDQNSSDVDFTPTPQSAMYPVIGSALGPIYVSH